MNMTLEEAMGRCWAEIDLDRICENYRNACRIAKNAKVICVLKGNAYGMGLVPVCKALREEGSNFFAVASSSEAETLLDTFSDIDVLILGLVPEAAMSRLISRNAIFTLYSETQGQALIRAAEKAGRPARVHVKLDTGLHRIGFNGAEDADRIAALHSSGKLNMEGLFTHLALHDHESDLLQFTAFDAAEEALRTRGVTFRMRHMCDSIGMVRYPNRHMDAVRTGAWLYGVYPKGYEHPELSALAVRFCTRVAQVRTVAPGERLGYDDDYYLEHESRIASLSAGYADGTARHNNVGEVEIHGHRAPVKGLVCMDQMMVDVTDIPDVCEGDVAVFLGDGIGIDEYAAWGKQNRNEALNRLTPRCVRIYRHKGKTWVE